MLKKFFNSVTTFILLLAAFIALVMLNFVMWNKDLKQEKTITSLHNELKIQMEENAKIAETNEKLRRKIQSLKQGSLEMIEEEARSGFGMVGKGETYYHFKTKPKQ
ncbi:MAG: septum formation initiator family protein [Gammaproteobacteria bacterium]|nr:septum formation initiator family protein [Gammaproteobacteria bacterium]